MNLQPFGAALASRYTVEREIGRGGMATVYLARDLRHERHVALKVLNPELGAVLGVERFLAEIRVTANLQHPNLLPLFDSGEANNLLFYVMPYVEGESLRDRLNREKQLPVDEAVRIALAVANALDYAHARNVIHRDLKPENILLQHGQPVVADFGIALAVSRAGGGRITQTGLSLGTPQYMSPEQATGDREIDGRSDIYSLGAILYELLGGEAPHTGSTGQAIIAKLMTEEPRPITGLRRAVPAHLAMTVHRSLEKLPADRWSSAKEFADALRSEKTGAMTMPPAMAASLGPRTPRWIAGVAVAAVVAAAVEGVALARRPAPAAGETLRFQFVTTDSERFVSTTPAIPFSISPDDRKVVYAGAGPTLRRLYVRGLDDMQTRPLAGTEGAPLQPTFSPDGRWIAFVIDGRLVKIPVEGGQVSTILPLEGRTNAGMSWVHPDTILASVGGALMAVPVNGGTPVVLSRPDTARGEILQWGPRVANARYVAYISVSPAGMSANRIGVLDRKIGRATVTELRGTTVLGAVDDRVLYVTPEGSLMAAAIDGAGRLGKLQLVLEDVLVRPGGAAKATLSAKGSLLYHRGASVSQLMVADEHGVVTPLGVEPRAYGHPRWSPDGSQVAVSIGRPGGSDIWIVDVRAKSLARLTPGDGNDDLPEWTSDGRRVVYRSREPRRTTLKWMPVDGSGPAIVLVDSAADVYSGRVSPDGKWVAFGTSGLVGSRGDIGYASVSGDRSLHIVAATPETDYTPAFSPDGRLLAYGSAPNGRIDVFVRPFPGPGAAMRITLGGHEPVWSRDGSAIYYRSLRTIKVARLAPAAAGAVPSVIRIDSLFTGDFLLDPGYGHFDASPDGRKFLVLQSVDRQAETILIHGWAHELRKGWR